MESKQLDQSYDALDRLIGHQHLHGASPELEQEIAEAWAHLDELQDAARMGVRQQLEASMELSHGRLDELLRKVKDELGMEKQHEDDE